MSGPATNYEYPWISEEPFYARNHQHTRVHYVGTYSCNAKSCSEEAESSRTHRCGVDLISAFCMATDGQCYVPVGLSC